MKKDITLIGVIVSLLFLFTTANATVWYVHPDSALNSIQAGIDSTTSGDTVLVAPGIYYENIDFNGHNIVLGSLFLITGDATYISSTIIDGDLLGSVVTFESGEDSTAVITGFTIQNGYANQGGGVHCDSSSPSLANVTISGNTAISNVSSYGGGIYCWSSSPSLENVTISGNTASGYVSSYGGGIYCWSSSPSLANVTISGNTADYSGGIYCSSNSSPSLLNCILWDDTPQEIYFSSSGDPNSITVSYSDVEGGEAGIVTNDNGTANWLEGNIDADPVFVSGPLSDYHLCPFTPSPCIDAGNPDPQYNDPENPLIPGYAMWPALGTIRNDMGVYGGPGTEVWATSIEEDRKDFLPISFSLKQNYPNPFRAKTDIQFILPKSTQVSIKIYDVAGRLVKTLVDGEKSAGSHKAYWDGTDQHAQRVSTGIYFCKFSAGDFNTVKKMILLR